MTTPAYAHQEHEIDTKIYDRSVRIFNTLKRLLRIHIKLHSDRDRIQKGDIFLFNHFSRVETFIPHYLFHQEAGVYCRSVASKEFFRGDEDDNFTNLLLDVGAVPNDHPHLLPYLAAEILRGRKVVIFPEGGMVKDRRVVDDKGEYSIYSRTAKKRRKQHSGPAVLAIALEAFKLAVLRANERRDMRRLERWTESLRLPSVAALVEAARRPTSIVPANITFYPLYVDDNILRQGVARFSSGLSMRASEELLIEGNLILKETDMDIRLGTPLIPRHRWGAWQRLFARYLGRRSETLDDFFNLAPLTRSLPQHTGNHRSLAPLTRSFPLSKSLAALTRTLEHGISETIMREFMRETVDRLRDDYMDGMYQEITVNLSHVAASLIIALMEGGVREIEKTRFHQLIYLAVKRLQGLKHIHLHRKLVNPVAYSGVLHGEAQGLRQFLQTALDRGLIATAGLSYRFLDKIEEAQDFDRIRVENPLVVYANEIEPLTDACDAIYEVAATAGEVSQETLALLRFDDERVAYQWQRYIHNTPEYEEINRLETASANGEPYFLLPKEPRTVGVLLVHGFLASPAELRDYGEHLHEKGYAVLGVRLPGHGTSPWDLRKRSYEDWMEAVDNAYRVLSVFCPMICLVGFSTGGALCLLHAASRPPGLAGVVAVAAPMRFRNTNMVYVPLVHRANELVRWTSTFEGMMPFRPNLSEHPDINYRHMPVRGLYELRRMVDQLEKGLPEIRADVLLMQASHDQVVDPTSLGILTAGLTHAEKTIVSIPSTRHGILSEDIGITRPTIDAFIASLCPSCPE
jgi:esterase/lipase